MHLYLVHKRTKVGKMQGRRNGLVEGVCSELDVVLIYTLGVCISMTQKINPMSQVFSHNRESISNETKNEKENIQHKKGDTLHILSWWKSHEMMQVHLIFFPTILGIGLATNSKKHCSVCQAASSSSFHSERAQEEKSSI